MKPRVSGFDCPHDTGDFVVGATLPTMTMSFGWPSGPTDADVRVLHAAPTALNTEIPAAIHSPLP
jgi:hypothetical protein